MLQLAWVVVQDIQQGLLSVEKNDVYKKDGFNGVDRPTLLLSHVRFVTFGIGTSTNSALDIDWIEPLINTSVHVSHFDIKVIMMHSFCFTK